MAGPRAPSDPPLAPRAGIGLKAAHVREVVAARPDLGFFEVHTENYMGDGGPAHHSLEAVRRDYALSLHGVALSLGGADPLDGEHLRATRRLVDRYQPALVSEHLAWSGAGGVYANDLLPLPLTEEALDLVCAHVDRVQEALGRAILVENPSSYLRFTHSTLAEPEFLAALAARTGCGLLLDVNNVHVSAANLGFDPVAYIDAFPAAAVGEIHLAGHHVNEFRGRQILIDDHGSAVGAPVWNLFRRALARTGPVPALVEWDTDVPPLAVLLDEAAKAETILAEARRACAA
ncbi:MAG: DUF692 domain-containing protein [Hyphomicrobiales bacterium]|nr:DUF692 domain-containing protein [Hyphomicrobiales bacterium]MCP5371882.1 DUF692 domain-containing protein [Hyphomicrobiales bacterium]